MDNMVLLCCMWLYVVVYLSTWSTDATLIITWCPGPSLTSDLSASCVEAPRWATQGQHALECAAKPQKSQRKVKEPPQTT